MVKYIHLTLAFTALLNSVMVSAFLVPIPPPLNGGASSTTTTTVSLTSTPTTSSTTTIGTTTTDGTMSTLGADPSTTSPESTIQTARFLKARQVHNADYAANKNNVADSAAASPAPSRSEQESPDASTQAVDSAAAPPSPTANYDQRK